MSVPGNLCVHLQVQNPQCSSLISDIHHVNRVYEPPSNVLYHASCKLFNYQVWQIHLHLHGLVTNLSLGSPSLCGFWIPGSWAWFLRSFSDKCRRSLYRRLTEFWEKYKTKDYVWYIADGLLFRMGCSMVFSHNIGCVVISLWLSTTPRWLVDVGGGQTVAQVV